MVFSLFGPARIWSLFIHAAFATVVAAVVASILDSEFLYGWFFGVNAVALLSFGKDKLAAMRNWRRTPEATFLLMGLAGAFPAILTGRKLFNHKTTKLGFVIPMWVLFFGQIIFAAWWMGDVDVPLTPPPPGQEAPPSPSTH